MEIKDRVKLTFTRAAKKKKFNEKVQKPPNRSNIKIITQKEK